jgi:precorrin-2 dehydrogenase/sirohydrochlorin ferrochelatase
MGDYYPIFINLKGRSCLVVGGGKVAERKVKRLMECKANITVVSPDITEVLNGYSVKKKIEHFKRCFMESDLEDQFLVIGATNDPSINEKVSNEARKKKILVNIADSSDLCDFILPSLIKRGDLQIAISTEGKSPALAAKIKEELSELYGREYEEFLNLLCGFRKRVLKEIKDPVKRKRVFRSLVESDIITSLKANRQKEALDKAEMIFGEDH